MENYNNYKGNSHKEKEERQKEKEKAIVKTPAKVRKKSSARKVLNFFAADDAQDIGSYILLDVIKPAAKKLIWDILAGGLKMALFGDADTGSTKPGSASRISYQKFYEKDRDRVPVRSGRSRLGYDFDDIILETRSEAEDILGRMDEIVDNYGIVSVADFYDLAGIEGNHTDNKYGWTDIRNASIIRSHGGYIIKLPKALPID